MQLVDRNGQRYVVRASRIEDAEQLMDLINRLVAQRAYIRRQKPIKSVEEERQWLKEQIERVEKGVLIQWVVEKNGHIVAIASARKGFCDQDHLVEIGILVHPDWQGRGSGSALLNQIIKSAIEKWPETIVMLRVYPENKRAYALYRQLGFVEVARLPLFARHYDTYRDNIILYWPDSPLLRDAKSKKRLGSGPKGYEGEK